MKYFLKKRKKVCLNSFCLFFLSSLVVSKFYNSRRHVVIKPSSSTAHHNSTTLSLGLSKPKLLVKDTCTQKKYSCVIDSEKFCYVYFLAEPSGIVVREDMAKPEFRNLPYFDYTFASISRLAELTLLRILILVTHDVTQQQILFLRDISQQILVKQIIPAYTKMSISTVKSRHIHTFGKYEVLLPSNTMGFSRLVYMVNLWFLSPFTLTYTFLRTWTPFR